MKLKEKFIPFTTYNLLKDASGTARRLLLTAKLQYRKLAVIFALGVLCIVIADKVFSIPETNIFSRKVLAENGELLTPYLTKDGKWRLRTRLNEISPYLIQTILHREDKWFYYHPGVNPFAVLRAIKSHLIPSGRKSGASTITMQVARLLEPKPRTLTGKLREVLRAVQLEMHFSKDKILEMYLALIPFGGNIEGVTSASYLYFNSPPQRLSLAEAAALAVIPQNPNKFRPDKNTAALLNERNRLLSNLQEDNLFPAQQISDARSEQIPGSRLYFTPRAQHLCYRVTSLTPDEEIRTFLDMPMQKSTEAILAQYAQELLPKGITNCTAIIVENSTGKVKVYCGSAGFDKKESEGEVNGLIANRSPGSALKPVLYTLAFEHGNTTPAMRVTDVSKEFSGFEPENFDRTFSGLVRIDYALLNSLNIPAVSLLQETGLPDFLETCSSAGFEDINKKKNKLGLSVILGGCGVTSEELAGFYSALANNGSYKKLNLYAGQVRQGERKLFSPEAAYLTWSVLSSNARPDIPEDFAEKNNLGKFAWKTGTSFGKKDAWAAGYNKQYTIVVWIGNFNGDGSPFLTGATLATPLLFRILRGVTGNAAGDELTKPDGVQIRTVCAESGLPAGDLCNKTEQAYYIKGRSHSSVCNWHTVRLSDKNKKYQYCFDCLPDAGYFTDTVTLYPSELLPVLPRLFTAVLPHNPQCGKVISGAAPVITSPSENFEYILDRTGRREIALNANSLTEAGRLYWYINGKLFCISKPGSSEVYYPKDNEKQLRVECADETGRSSARTIRIKWI